MQVAAPFALIASILLSLPCLAKQTDGVEITESGWTLFHGAPAKQLFDHLAMDGDDHSATYTQGIKFCAKTGSNISCYRKTWGPAFPNEGIDYDCRMLVRKDGSVYDQSDVEIPGRPYPKCR